MEIIKQYRHLLLFGSLAAVVLSACMMGFLFVSYRKAYNVHWEEAKRYAISQTNKASKKMVKFVDVLKPIAQSIADELSKKDLSQQEIEALLKKKKTDSVVSVGVALFANGNTKDKLYSLAYLEKEGKFTLVHTKDAYEQAKKENDWFNKAIKNGAGFVEPFKSLTAETTVAQYVVPIYRTGTDGKKTAIGAAYASQSLEHLQHIIETLFLGRNGYWFILTETGSFLAYPQLKYQDKKIFDIAADQGNPDLADAAKKIITGKSIIFEYNNEITGAPSWLVSEPIEGTSWSIVGVFDQGELDLDSNEFRHRFILPSLAFLLCVIFLSSSFLLWYDQRTLLQWTIAMAAITCALFIQIIWIWYAIYHYPYVPDEPNIYRVEDRLKVYEYMEKYTQIINSSESEKKNKEIALEDQLLKMTPNVMYVPTGIYITSLQFAEANEIKLSAYFWQRFSKGYHDKIPRGFVFIQTNDATITEEGRILDRDGQEEVITYDVFAKLYQFLTYTLYPFDQKSLRIKYWSKTSDEDFRFIPDLASYQLINPKSLPGVDPDVYIPGWTLIGSYFGFQSLPYTTNFGSYSVGPFGVYRELDISAEAQPFFEIVVRRNLVDALVSDLLPIAVIAVLLFLLLLITGADNDRYLTTIASIFFATIFAQIRFRSKIPQAQIVYLESLYFILYVIMLILLATSFLVQHKIQIKYLTEHDNIVIKLLYWPAFFGSFVIISLFYLW